MNLLGISVLKYLWYRQARILADLEDLDSASRGPWGSFLLLLNIRRGQYVIDRRSYSSHSDCYLLTSRSYLATFSALLTILALAIDPFTQQVLQFQNFLRESQNEVASIPKSNSYSATGEQYGYGPYHLDVTMANAVNVGLTAPPKNVSSLITTSRCTSGNCTFPTTDRASFSTLGICHSCLDIADKVKNNTDVNYTNLTIKDTGMEVASPIRCQVAVATPVDTEIIALNILMLNDYDAEIKGSLEVSAFRCSLFPCVKTYGETSPTPC